MRIRSQKIRWFFELAAASSGWSAYLEEGVEVYRRLLESRQDIVERVANEKRQLRADYSEKRTQVATQIRQLEIRYYGAMTQPRSDFYRLDSVVAWKKEIARLYEEEAKLWGELAMAEVYLNGIENDKGNALFTDFPAWMELIENVRRFEIEISVCGGEQRELAKKYFRGAVICSKQQSQKLLEIRASVWAFLESSHLELLGITHLSEVLPEARLLNPLLATSGLLSQFVLDFFLMKAIDEQHSHNIDGKVFWNWDPKHRALSPELKNAESYFLALAKVPCEDLGLDAARTLGSWRLLSVAVRNHLASPNIRRIAQSVESRCKVESLPKESLTEFEKLRYLKSHLNK